MSERIPKALRFEVFKRDKFKCQYCGAEAPNVLLHADHIRPAVDGGETTLLNLVTSCAGCNLGKGARPLTDDSAVAKQRNQLEELQERREQLEMMLAWHDALRDLEGDTIQAAASAWYKHAPGWSFTEHGLAILGKHVRKFGLSAVLSAMQVAADQYLHINADGKATEESWEAAIAKVPGICRNEQIRRDDPEGAAWLHVSNACRKSLSYWADYKGRPILRDLRSAGGSVQLAWDILRDSGSWSEWREQMHAAIEELQRSGQPNHDEQNGP